MYVVLSKEIHLFGVQCENCSSQGQESSENVNIINNLGKYIKIVLKSRNNLRTVYIVYSPFISANIFVLNTHCINMKREK